MIFFIVFYKAGMEGPVQAIRTTAPGEACLGPGGTNATGLLQKTRGTAWR